MSPLLAINVPFIPLFNHHQGSGFYDAIDKQGSVEMVDFVL